MSPTGVERTFGTDEIIVSKTDAKGRITYANDVFLRVSGYREDEVLGQPHNLVRHPDTPRALFHLVWRTLERGDEVFCYVNNLAADGSHYWVLAHMTPSRRAGATSGYHSNRRRPEPGAVAAADALYRRLRAAERAQEQPRQALATSVAMLDDVLAERGQTYDEYVWSLINAHGRR